MDADLTRVRRLSIAARSSTELAAADREARDAAIEEAERAGWSVREIAAVSGLSHGRIQSVIVARTAARQERLAQRAVSGDPSGPVGTN